MVFKMDVEFTQRKSSQKGRLKLQMVMFAHYPIARPDDVRMSKPPKEQL